MLERLSFRFSMVAGKVPGKLWKVCFFALILEMFSGFFPVPALTPASASGLAPELPALQALPSLPSRETFGMHRPPAVGESRPAHVMPSLEKRGLRVKLQLDWPAHGQISSGFGMRRLGNVTRMHEGIDIPLPEGTPIRAARAGVVSEARVYNGYGKTIIIDHGQGVKTLYAHCSNLLVDKGRRVEVGMVIARAGGTGYVTDTHLHFGVMVAGRFQDPLKFLKNPPAQLARQP
ncbi:MAG: M23 family metallopeptidase [Fretibacterium sp.]|nr:M23 family metallopeptidase [Fretibacterium sp.]